MRAAGSNSNLLLNVGPMATGVIQPEFVSRLKKISQGLSKNGEAIYGTRGGPITPRSWGATTQKGNTIYIHVLDWRDAELALPRLHGRIKSAPYLKDGSKAECVANDSGLLLTIAQRARDDYDTIAVLDLAQD